MHALTPASRIDFWHTELLKVLFLSENGNRFGQASVCFQVRSNIGRALSVFPFYDLQTKRSLPGQSHMVSFPGESSGSYWKPLSPR